MKQIARRITGWLLVLSMVTSMFGQTPLTFTTSADDVIVADTPGLSFSMVYVSGGNSVNQSKDSGSDGSLSPSLKGKNSALLGRGKSSQITVNLVADLNAGRGTANGMYFELELPVFKVENGTVTQLTRNQIAELKEEDFTKPGSNLVRVMAEFTPADPDLWDGYVSGKAYWGSGVRIYRQGSISGGTQEVVETKLYFDGNMPENSAAIIKLGGGYSEYKYNDKSYPEFSQPAISVADQAATFTMICCNLEWEPKIEVVEPKNVMWNKYNYITYKITIKNTSKDKESYFAGSSIQVVAPTNLGTVDGWSSGLHVENAAKFLYNDGDPIPNDDFESSAQREKYMVGVPGQGGIMIYDVTEVEATEAGRNAMANWDMTDFTNIKDADGNKLSEIPYYFKPDGGIYFSKTGKVYNEEGAKVNTDGEKYDHTTFYVAIPMSTDIPSSKIDSISIKAYDTITFGNDYTWTKTTNHNTGGFDQPKDSMTGKKYVVETEEQNGQEVEVEKSKIEVAINDEADYYLGHFKNTGNIPLFNAAAIDTIDKDFDLRRISAIFNIEDGEDEPELSDWINKDGNVEFEFTTHKKPDGTGEEKTEFITLGKMTPDASLSNDKQRVWSFNVGNLIQGYIDSVVASGKSCDYTGRFRIKFKKQINPNEEFNGKIQIHGVVGKGKLFKNKLDSTYEKWIWNPTFNVDDDSGYVKTEKKLDTDEADIQAIVANPQIDAQVVHKTSSGYTYADPMTIAVDDSSYGFFYQLGNNSPSRIVPGAFDTGAVATVDSTSGDVTGFITEKVVLSKRLVNDIADIKSIVIHTSSKKDITVTADELIKDSDGNYYIDKSKWESEGELLSATVNVNTFEKNIQLTAANKDIYVVLEGHANIVTPKGRKYGITTTGEFTTKYKDESLNIKEEDAATMIVAESNPLIDVQVIEKDGRGYKYANSMHVPVNVSGYGFFYQLANDSISCIKPGKFSTGTVATNDTNTGDVRGLITNKVLLSKRLVEDIAQVYYVSLTMSSGNTLKIPIDDFEQDDNGNYYIGKQKWKSEGEILSAEVTVKRFSEKIELNAANKDIYMALEGTTNKVTVNGSNSNAFKPTGKIETNYKNTSLNKSAADAATMYVDNINPIIRGKSYGREYVKNSTALESKDNNVSGSADQSKIEQIEVPKGIDNSGYKFWISNGTVSPAGKTKVAIDLSSSVGNKTTNSVNVRGFLTKTITISDFEDVADIAQVRLFNWDKNPNTDTADATIPFSALKVVDGKVTITLKDYTDIEYLKYMVIDMNDFYAGKTSNAPEMKVQIDGETKWFGNLDAKLTLTPDDYYIKGQGNTKGAVSLTDRLYIAEPYAELNADVHYYELDGTTETADSLASKNRDKNNKRLGVPYDRDFIYTLDVGNNSKSKLDDLDITVDLTINDNQQGDESHTGFHTTGIRISKDLIEQYEKLESIMFYGVDGVDGKKYTIDYANGRLISEDGTIIEGIIDNGDIYINEQKIYTEFGLQIPNLKKFVIKGKGFQAQPDAPLDDKHRITVYGFSDSPINSWNTMTADAVNYVEGFRSEPGDFVFKSHDTSQAYISKMYFDTTIVAGYKDNNGSSDRFDEVADSYEHVRPDHTHSYSEHWPNDDTELDIGYKAIGSYLLDFRQYLNSGSNVPTGANHQDLSDMAEHSACTANNYVYTQSMNTAADVEMTVDLPADLFDAYYMKVHPYAYDYIEYIKIHRQGDDNDTWSTVTSWKDSVEKITGATGKDTYYRVDLRKLGDDYGIYESPKTNYQVDKPVDKIVIKLNINRDASEVKGDATVAKNADYGTWYEKTKYMFEVTGRFYKEGAADATCSTKMDIGQFDKRSDVVPEAKRRTDEGNSKDDYNDINTAYRSAWSWQDQYHYSCDYWHTFYNYDASHLFSTAKVYVYHEKNKVAKGVHKTTNVKQDQQAKFSAYNEYVVSFTQTADGSKHDCYSAHAGIKHGGSTSYINDPYNWSGKHAYTDNLVLTDTLPYVRPDKDTGYYGFLTKKIFISKDIEQYIDKIVVYKKKATLDSDGNCTETKLSDTIELTAKDLVEEDTTATKPAQIQGSDAHVVHSTVNTKFYEIPVVYPTDSSTSTKGAIVLGDNEYITKYEIHMKDLPGDVDYAAELKGRTDLLDSYDHGSVTDPDVYVGGDIYRVTNDNIVASGEKNDWNTMKSDSYMQNSDESYYTSSDKALITSYRIPFQGGFTITRNNSTDTINDYKSDNVTPNSAKYDVRIWNRKDTNDEQGRSAELDSATVTNTMNANYRLKNIYIPTQLVEGDWFNIDYIQLDKDKIELADLKTSEYFKKDASGKRYVFDVNAYIKDNLDKMTSFTPNNISKDATASESKYYYEKISKFIVKFKGVGKGTLDGGEFLNGKLLADDKESLADITIADSEPAFSYDGVFVDRSEKDIKDNQWTLDSKPTIINGANAYQGSPNYNYVDVAFTTSDTDSWSYGYRTDTGGNAKGTTTYDYYRVNNLVSTMTVNMKRESKIKSGTTSFAYDVDGTTKVAVDKNHLIPDDYVEYQITIGADKDTMIPLYHPDMRFNAPTG